ncbi:Holliday junction branch migration protein RuvA [Arthrospira platensis]|jgi:Holliday junction DNA helicase RuvA|uniref:Holliday junction branch migration complex subunit RuvA n=1 Tax=Limnospira platensis NIES-46 TaxID=1236695 RepID=A0A5M3T3G4_LIMPL|nr:Holliday junction branch migration protein RuvA [Arthrospira platensis]AMW31021.1 ATP-dependent DNA helicase RuvA [Arthrospira platensis YZ]KDR54796.1 ATP-dependent DNA helicase RuvA [Arthrospira platensis str. Paraca]MBD2670534.1 Holliday junction branch migration protein RuvA [Arthrospira platensis FACHB-439]MBD2711373.1 Holliday junction branch migration protein RuvA [Arthrospira platensis FACHB-835]MDF2208402.1 Holliday junction branch migration protein RuvA [Arthrospira platensis NCB00
MIGYLNGTVAGIYKKTGNRVILYLDVNGVGYELQILPRMQNLDAKTGENLQVFTHLQVRDDLMVLYGFSSMAERDLFRQLVSVSGIGMQLAIALLDTLELPDLVQAIVGGNTGILTKTPGVGKKTAERITLELKTKLSEWRKQAGLPTVSTSNLSAEIQEEVEMSLLALGYTSSEVMQALTAITSHPNLAENNSAEDWIKYAISIL